MNPLFASRRRADEFDLLLSRTSARHPAAHDETSAAYRDLLEVVSTLRATPAPRPRADFSADLRARLMIAAESALAPDTAEQSAARRAPAVRRSPRERRIVAAVGGFAIVSATASMAVAAQSALPGDTLYPLKRALENAQTGVQRDADGKGTTLLDNASGRLAEVDALSRSGDDAGAIATTLDDFVQQATEASTLLLSDYASTGHASSIEELRAFTADSMGALTSLQSVIPVDARASLIEATQIINAIDVQAQSLCPACTDLPIMQAPVFAQQSIAPVIDGALNALSTSDSPGTTSPEKSHQKPGKGKTAGADPAPTKGQGSTQSEAPAKSPDEPVLPQSPAGSDDGGKSGGNDGGSRTPLDDLKISGSDDPVGDLLTGTGKVVDTVVKDLGLN